MDLTLTTPTFIAGNTNAEWIRVKANVVTSAGSLIVWAKVEGDV